MKLGNLGRVFSAKPALLILVLALKAVLDVSYVYVVSPYLSWTPTRYPLSPNFTKVVESYLLTLLLAVTLPSRIRRPSDFLVTMLLLNPILPTLSMYGLADRAREYSYMIGTSFLIIRFVQRMMPRIRIRFLNQGHIVGIGLSTLGIIVTLSFFVRRGGFQYFDLSYLVSFNTARLYALREVVNEALFARVGLPAYVAFWTYYVFVAALLVVSLQKKRYVVTALLLVLPLIFMGLSGRRGVLGAVPILLGTYIIVERRGALSLMTAGFLIMVAASTLLALVARNFLPSALITERSFFTHARLNYGYYELFSKAGFTYLSNTHIPVPIDYPFDVIPEVLVAREVLHSESVASAGFLATSYMHFGFPGMLVFALIVGLLLKLIDSLIVNRVPMRVGVPLAAVTFNALFTSSDLTTALVTYGILPAMFLLWLLGSRRCWQA